MNTTTREPSRHTNRLAWLITPLFLIAMAITGGVSVLMASATAPTSPLNGHYEFRGLTTSGPKNGVYITGKIELLVTGTTLNGHLCGLNASNNPSHCTVITGTTDGTNVTFTINSVANFPAIHVVGAFVTDLLHKGASGFTGTYTFGATSKVSGGNWTGLNAAVPSIAGAWDFYSIVQQGHEKGYEVHGTVILVPHANDTYTGILCIKTSKAPCVPVKGTYLYSYIRLYLGSPAEMVLRGTYTFSGSHIASGQFYITDKASGDKGYWLMHRDTNEDK